MKTVRYGDIEAPVFEREWRRTPHRLPYRKTYLLKRGDRWVDAPTTETLWEHYVQQADGTAIPAGAMVAREMIAEGATIAVWTECYGARRIVIMSPDLVCVDLAGELSEILHAIREATGKRWAGVPDAIALFPEGRIAMRDAKVVGKDRVSETQHTFARAARQLFGNRIEFAAVEWRRAQAIGRENKEVSL